MRIAFNKENPTELMGQLVKVLQQRGMRDVLELLKRHRIPQAINDAWLASKGMSADDFALLQGRVASRYLLAATLEKTLAGTFPLARDLVTDWSKFLVHLGFALRVWDSNAARAVRESKPKKGWRSFSYNSDEYTTWSWTDVTVKSSRTVTVDVTVTGGPKKRYYDDDYDRSYTADADVPDEVVMKGHAVVNVPLLVRGLLTGSLVKSLIRPGKEKQLHSYMLEVFGGRASSRLWAIMATSSRAWVDDIVGGIPGRALSDYTEVDLGSSTTTLDLDGVDVLPTKQPKVTYKAQGNSVRFDIVATGKVDQSAVPTSVDVEYDYGY